MKADVLVALPAHDEAATVAVCLTAVTSALAQARHDRTVARVMVALSAHRCSDATAATAREVLAATPDIEHLVIEDGGSGPVGAVRSRLVGHAVTAFGLAEPPGVPRAPAARAAWLFCTDADTVVPLRWISQMLDVAQTQRADAVAGLVDLTDWTADPVALAAYNAIIAAGLLPGGGHTHAYAANLAVRLQAYRSVGGFPAPAHGEEHALLAALRTRGYRVATPRHVRVTTSGRIPGRAPGGLSDLLRELAPQPSQAPSTG